MSGGTGTIVILALAAAAGVCLYCGLRIPGAFFCILIGIFLTQAGELGTQITTGLQSLH